MKISDIAVNKDYPARVQTHTDALAVFSNQTTKDAYLERHGDIEVIPSKRIFVVPSLKAERKSFIAAKIKDCNKWGNE
jgi:hypothetical protein